MKNYGLVRWLSVFLSVGTVISLIGCAAPTTQRVSVSDASTKAEQVKQYELAIVERVKQADRLSRIYHNIAIRSKMLCGEDVGPILGFRVGTRSKGEMGEVYSRLYKLDERPTVINVIAGGAAERAGLKARDVINKMNGVDSADRTAITSMLKSLPSKESVNLLIRRDGVDMNVSIQPEIGCKYPIQTSDEQVINAYADGEKIVIAMGMMNFARDDNELALVVAHELAHNTMKHIEAKKKNMGAGLLADLAVILISRGQVSNTQFTQAGANSYSQEFEAEADYVGLYIMANAGLPIKDAPSFWRRMATAHPGSIKTNHAASHPSTAYRMVALEEAVKEIETKIAKNEPLIPNEKKVK